MLAFNEVPAAIDHKNWDHVILRDVEVRNSVPRCNVTQGENYQRPDCLENLNGTPHGNIFYNVLLRDGENNCIWQFHGAGAGDELRGAISLYGGTVAAHEGGGMGGLFYIQNVTGGSSPVRFTDNMLGEGFNRVGEVNGTSDGPQDNIYFSGNIGFGGGICGTYTLGCSMGGGYVMGDYRDNTDITFINNIEWTWLQNRHNYSPGRSGGGVAFGVHSNSGDPIRHSNYFVSNNIVVGSYGFTLVNPVNSRYLHNTWIAGQYECGKGYFALASGYTLYDNTYYRASSAFGVWNNAAPTETAATVFVGPPTQNVTRRKVIQDPNGEGNKMMNVTVFNWQSLSQVQVDLSVDDFGTPFLADGANYKAIYPLNPFMTYSNGQKNGIVTFPINPGFQIIDPVCDPFFALPCIPGTDVPYPAGTTGGGGHGETTLPDFLTLRIIKTN